MQIVLLSAAILITALCAVLVAAAWRNDRTIERDLGVATAEVLSAAPPLDRELLHDRRREPQSAAGRAVPE
ncbi:hypothetical protein [Tsukamurella sp. PLM1]|uniref:hypothetical protein n=1 Tax=Tsukamurella sp. PLM1 TaxID=2929795 RepID=UPI0020C093C5|nr:hypothetical protein [Tsukamurella sp. PLM1]